MSKFFFAKIYRQVAKLGGNYFICVLCCSVHIVFSFVSWGSIQREHDKSVTGRTSHMPHFKIRIQHPLCQSQSLIKMLGAQKAFPLWCKGSTLTCAG